jgi:uncharacterized protein
MTLHPIPTAALDDRLAIVGSAGSGKTYTASGAVERVLDLKGRVIVIDPLGVWFGLRLMPDGKTPSRFNPVVFGGYHGDLPISEHAGALIGETVAGMVESSIIDLSQIGTKNGERRFMLAFLTALYRKTNGEPVHVVFDEADMFAPQKLLDKEGDAAKLLGMMETIVRRGRIKGFIPYLITQRPAVLSKDVLSQADGIIAMKLTASQDRDAIGAWIEGQGDKATGKEILASLPSKQQGEGVIWIPSRGVLEQTKFPVKTTFDSSRTPKRGEKKLTATLKPLDLGAIKDKLATITAEAKESDPKLLKAEIAKLRKEAFDAGKLRNPVIDPKALQDAEALGYERGCMSNLNAIYGFSKDLADSLSHAEEANKSARRLLESFGTFIGAKIISKETISQKELDSTGLRKSLSQVNQITKTAVSYPKPMQAGLGKVMPGPQRKLLTVLAQFPQGRTKKQLAVQSGYSHNGGAFNNPLANLRSRGWAQGGSNLIVITDMGRAALGEWTPLPEGEALRDYWFKNLEGPQAKLLRVLCAQYPQGLGKNELASACGYEPSGGAFNNPLARLRALELVTGKGGAQIRASDNLF